MHNEILWAKNGWSIERLPGGYIIVGIRNSLTNDNPCKMPDGKIVYDFPERLPKYVKKQVARIMGGKPAVL